MPLLIPETRGLLDHNTKPNFQSTGGQIFLDVGERIPVKIASFSARISIMVWRYSQHYSDMQPLLALIFLAQKLRKTIEFFFARVGT
jgi:hypothetical protein